MRWTHWIGGVGGACTAALILAAHARGATAPDAACAKVAHFSIQNGSITLAEAVDAGALTVQGVSAATARALPAFCRVAATLTPSRDSDVRIELWLPASGWNGKLQAVGNGAFTGSIAYSAMATALPHGYAVGSTDTGHAGGSAGFGLGHPEKVVDFGWRSVHELTVAGKRLVAEYYDAPPKHSYWTGCSAGGRQALKEAQRFPADYDGIVAGAPGLDWTGRAARAVQVAQRLEKNPAARLSQADAQRLHRAVLDACDAADGVKDGVIEDPARCAFDPAALQCPSTGAGQAPASCLSAAQVETARLLYAPAVNPKTKREITGLFRGSELGWTDLGWSASARATGLDQFRFLVFGDASWTIDRFDFDRDIARAEDADDDTINALDPNLKPFLDRGGKLIQYHGWSDPQISPGNSTQYFTRVAAALGGADRLAKGYRLFMVPGMAHCGGGEGPNSFDMVDALENWVEHGRAPDRIVAKHVVNGAIERTRPLCPYPQVAVYSGAGSTNDAASFACRAR